MNESNEKIALKVLKVLARNLYLQGEITEDQVNDKQLIEKLVLEDLERDGGLYLVTDHRDDLLKHAKYFHKMGSKNMAIVMYAMFFEHAINAVIAKTLSEDGIKNKTKNEILRSAALKAKLSWILEILYLPKFNDKHKKFILNIAEERNSFVHYKFNAIHEDDDPNEKTDKLLVDIMKSVKYMKTYSTRVEYSGKKHTIEARLSKL